MNYMNEIKYIGCKEWKPKSNPADTAEQLEEQKRVHLYDMENQQLLPGGMEYFLEPKHDGIWSEVHIDDRHVPHIYSRTGKDKTDQVPQLAYILRRCNLPSNTVLIGELGIGSQEAIQLQTQYGHDYINLYDVLYCDSNYVGDRILSNRLGKLTTMLRYYLTNDERQMLRQSPVYSRGFMNQYNLSSEGVVLKPMHQTYANSTWIKVKKQSTYDMVILDYEVSSAPTKQVGYPMAATLVCGCLVNGDLTPLTKVSIGALAWCKDVAENFENTYRGQVVELAAYKQFDSGALRHPHIVANGCGGIKIRDDKDAKECIFETGRAGTGARSAM